MTAGLEHGRIGNASQTAPAVNRMPALSQTPSRAVMPKPKSTIAIPGANGANGMIEAET